MGRMRNRAVIGVVAGLLLLALAGGWYWFSGPYLERHALFVPDGKTVTLQNGSVDVSCRRTSDCDLVDPTFDYRQCDWQGFCLALQKETVAVNSSAFKRLSQINGFPNRQQCRDRGAFTLDCPLTGIFPSARCVRGRCIVLKP